MNTKEEVRKLYKETDPPIIKILNLILRDAIDKGVNVVVFISDSVQTKVLFDNEIYLQAPKFMIPPMIARVKIVAKLNLADHQNKQTGNFQVRHSNKSYQS